MSVHKKALYDWAIEALQPENIQHFTEVRIMPWSAVYRLKTNQATYYLKQLAKPFAIEPILLKYWQKSQNSLVPEMIAANFDLNCFLMKDQGHCLRPLLKQVYQEELVCSILSAYAQLQQREAGQVQELVGLGVPDWQLVHLPQLYQDLLTKKDFLLKEGLSLQEFETLQSLQPQIVSLCQKLADYRIPETIEHGDFQDNNILAQEDAFYINDWGDAVIAHPFFSLVAFLDSARRNHGIAEGSHRYCRLRDAYLDEWLAFGTKEQLLRAFELAKHLGIVKFAVGFYRVALCPGMEDLGQYHGAIAEALRKFIP